MVTKIFAGVCYHSCFFTFHLIYRKKKKNYDIIYMHYFYFVLVTGKVCY